jgi:hypothetical protein
MKKPRCGGAKSGLIEGLPSCDARQTHRDNTTAGCTARGAEKAPPGSGAKSTMRAAEKRRRKRGPHRHNTTETVAQHSQHSEAGTNCCGPEGGRELAPLGPSQRL